MRNKNVEFHLLIENVIRVERKSGCRPPPPASLEGLEEQVSE